MNIPDELIKKIIDNLEEAISKLKEKEMKHEIKLLRLAIPTDDDSKQFYVTHTGHYFVEDEIKDTEYKAGYIQGQIDSFKEVDDRVKKDTSQDPEEKRALGHDGFR